MPTVPSPTRLRPRSYALPLGQGAYDAPRIVAVGKPFRPLKRYCSPACGQDCLRSSYEKAKREGTRLKKQLKAPGWEIQYVEWCGAWTYLAEHRPSKLRIYPGTDPGTFDVGISGWALRTGKTPEQAYRRFLFERRRQLRHAKETVERLSEELSRYSLGKPFPSANSSGRRSQGKKATKRLSGGRTQ